MSPSPTGNEPVTVTVARRVTPGREQEFEDWASRLTAAASRFRGFLGAGLLRPGRLGEDWHVVYRFDTQENLAEWEGSGSRAALLAAADHLMDTTGVQRITGLESWFELPGRTAPAPPKWKMFAVSVAAIYLLQLALNPLIGPRVAGWPLPLRVAVLASLVTALMTWVVMPRAARALEGWLYASAGGS